MRARCVAGTTGPAVPVLSRPGAPGLGLLTMGALYAERDLCQAIVSHGRDYLVGLPGGTTWWDYLVGLPGGTTWCESRGTSLSSGQCGPKELLGVFRNHWRVENSLHHVKDRSWDEDVPTLRRPGLGEVYATLVNTALNALRL